MTEVRSKEQGQATPHPSRKAGGEGLWPLFSTFSYIGLFTIGGGYAMIPLIQKEVVDKRQWVTHEELIDLMAVAQSCPGIFAINISIFIGYKLRKTTGAVLCALGAALPSFLIILAIALVFTNFRDNEIVTRVFRGIRPAVVALIAAPVFKMGKAAKLNRYTIFIPILSALAIWLLGINPALVILVAGFGGFIYGKVGALK